MHARIPFSAKLAAIAALAIVFGGGPAGAIEDAHATATATQPSIARPSELSSDAVPLDDPSGPNRLARFVRAVAHEEPAACNVSLRSRATVVSIVRAGTILGRGVGDGDASDTSPCRALKEATRRALAAAGAPASTDDVAFIVELPDDDGAMVLARGDEGVELSHGLLSVRFVDRAALEAQIAAGHDYLARVLDPDRGGAHKYYDARADRFEPVLHTVYSASTGLTFLKLFDRTHDPRDLALARRAARFVLSMQDATGPKETRGGFFYSFDLVARRHDPRVIVGTTSKSIFTLLALYEKTHERAWLDAATSAADWLTTMQRPDGSMRSLVRVGPGGALTYGDKESLLYTGQVLSALSRVYRVTHDAKYREAAARTAGYFAQKVARRGCFLGDGYRKPNPISSSWVVMALVDYDRATHDDRFESTIFRCADDLVSRQNRTSDDAYVRGRFQGAMSSSGVGWVAEVMSEVFAHCRETGGSDCDRYRDAVVAASRLLIEHTYSPANAFLVKNPSMANGGVFWSSEDRRVRTDAVCHATNALLGVIDDVADGPLVVLPRARHPMNDLAQKGAGEDAIDGEE